MTFLGRWFSKKNDASPAVTPPPAPPPAAVTLKPVTAADLAKFLAWDFKGVNEQWFVDTCLRMDINMANARFAWEAVETARLEGNEDFFRGALFMAQLAGANPGTRATLLKLMSGT